MQTPQFVGANVGANLATITQLQLLALREGDHGRTLNIAPSVRGQVRTRDGGISVYVAMRYRNGDKVREVRLGTWRSENGRMVGESLKVILDKAAAIRGQVAEGKDPVAQRQEQAAQAEAQKEVERAKAEADHQQALHEQRQRLQELAAKQARITIRGLFEHWQRLELVARADGGSEAVRSFEKDVFPLIGDIAAADMTKAHIQEVVDTIKARGTPSKPMIRSAKKTLADMRQMFGFALDRDYIAADPTAHIKKARLGKDTERDRVLSEPELIELFQKLPKAGMADTSMIALLLQLATLARIGEILGARWEHIDTDRRIWRLPENETKNGKEHRIWLSDFTLAQIERLRAITGLTPWLFPAMRTKAGRLDFTDSVCEKTVTKQVGDRQRPGGVPMNGRSKLVDALVLPGGKWTPHDLRRTGATEMTELGVLPDVVERCLNHTEEKKIKRIYQRAQYEGPMREAWRLWGERLELLQAQALGHCFNATDCRSSQPLAGS